MTPPDHDGVAVLQRTPLQHPPELPGGLSQEGPRPLELEGEGSVEHVRRGHAEMDVLGRVAHILGHVGQEGDHVVLGRLLDLEHAGDVEGRLRLDLGQSVVGYLAKLVPGLADSDLDLQPGGHLGLLGPEGGHLGGGVAGDHALDPAPGPRGALRSTPPAQPARAADGRAPHAWIIA